MRLLRDFARAHLGLEVCLADKEGKPVELARQQVPAPNNEFCRLSLHSEEGLRRCTESYRVTRDAICANPIQRAPYVHVCHLGFDIVACPVRGDGDGISGTLYVSGVVAEPLTDKERERLIERTRQLNPGDTDLEKAAARLPVLAGEARSSLCAMLESVASDVSRYELDSGRQAREVDAKKHTMEFEGVVGTSQGMQDVFRMLERIVMTDSTVLILGDSGTGKELVARAIHRNGPRRGEAFVAQNCSALPDTLLESCLFGHVRGSFTGAMRDHHGLFEAANNGTLFLDEIGDMSASLQVKLLRVLQEGTFQPVGSTTTRRVDVRVVCATHKDLPKMVQEGTFREDLFYRIHVIRLNLPPLRDRMEDLPLFVDHFLRKHHRTEGPLPRLSPGVQMALQRYAWPGNIRELENEIERLIVLGAGEAEIGVEVLSPRVREGVLSPRVDAAGSSGSSPSVPPAGTLKDAIEDLERRMIAAGLERTGGNKSQLAKELGISRSSLIIKVQQYGLEPVGKERFG